MSTAQAAEELKQQGAIEAARDPNSKVDADDAQRQIVESSKEAGVSVFSFNPDDSPEEKKAQARAVCCCARAPLASHSPFLTGRF